MSISVKSMSSQHAITYFQIPCYGAKTFTYKYSFDVNPGPVDFKVYATGSGGTKSIIDTFFSSTKQHESETVTVNLNGQYNRIVIDVRTTGSTRGYFPVFRIDV